jgi:Fe2+ transport system protein B
MIIIDANTKKSLIELAKNNQIFIEGNILKLIDVEGDKEFGKYINTAIEKDKENRKRRLDVTKQVQEQNKQLTTTQKENESLLVELKEALEKAEISNKEAVDSKNEAIKSKDDAESERLKALKAKDDAEVARHEAENARREAENAKIAAENDLEVMQKKSQFELIGTVVRVALFVIAGVGIITTLMYVLAITTGKETQIIGSAWTNMLGILLTNAFSIVGTIMGIKYATNEKND